MNLTFGFNILVKNLSQKWVFNSTANLNSNLGPFWCVMSTFNNQVTSRLTESGSEFFQFFFFTVEYHVSLRNMSHYSCKMGWESGFILVQLIQHAAIQINFHLQIYRHHNIIIIYAYLHVINNVRLQLNILTDCNNWIITWRCQLNRYSERRTARASWWKWNKLS